MVKLKGFYNEETLYELLYKKDITPLEFVYHHSQEMVQNFESFCQQKNIPKDDDSAKSFMDFLLKEEDFFHKND